MPGAKKMRKCFEKDGKNVLETMGSECISKQYKQFKGAQIISSATLLSTHIFEIVSCLYTESRNNIFSTYLKI